jgi:hypothetical protein
MHDFWLAKEIVENLCLIIDKSVENTSDKMIGKVRAAFRSKFFFLFVEIFCISASLLLTLILCMV